jgi:putative phosphoribosyl transferase
MRFRDRTDAGRRLAAKVAHLRGPDVVVLGLPRGGVPVAFEVAEAMGAPLDVIVVRKLGVPFQPELAMGAIGEDGVRVLNERVLRLAAVPGRDLARVEARERAELERRARLFRGDRPPRSLAGQTVIVVDDGIATGSTIRAACQVVRARGAARVVVAAPVAAPDTLRSLGELADEVVCLDAPAAFDAVGQAYADFAQTSDDTVTNLLAQAAQRDLADAAGETPGAADPPVRDEDVAVPVGATALAGHFVVPERCRGVVVFAHGSGSSRHSPRNRLVATALNDVAIATVLVDLLTVEEEVDRANVFDIELLAHRLMGVVEWVRRQPEVEALPVGLFGASTGAGAALWAASASTDVAAVVSRGGRPDLAERRLSKVTAPTLLIVGGDDRVVLGLNREAQAHLRCASRLAIVPGATHLFGEPGALEEVASLAATWFLDHFAPR